MARAERLADNSELETLRQLQTQMDPFVRANLDTFTQYVKLNEAFHFELVRLARSPQPRRKRSQENT